MGHPKKVILARDSWRGHSNKGTPIWVLRHGAPQNEHSKMDILSWEPWLDPWRLNSPNFIFLSFRSIYTKITINLVNRPWDVSARNGEKALGSTAIGEKHKAAQSQLHRGCGGLDCVFPPTLGLSSSSQSSPKAQHSFGMLAVSGCRSSWSGKIPSLRMLPA